MSKKKKSVFNIFIDSIQLYFSNIDKFISYMAFPVFGQILGLALIILLINFYTSNLPLLLNKFPSLDSFNAIIITALVLVLPGLIIFLKAFWEYLVAYGALNSMLDNMLKSGKVYDFNAHTELIKRRSFQYAYLWILISLLIIIGIIPVFWIIAIILFVCFALVFQVFAFETVSPIDCFKKSFQLVKNRFGATILLILLAGILTYVFIPQIFYTFFEVIKLNDFCENYLAKLFENVQYPWVNITFAEIIVKSLTAHILIQLTLPVRSIMFALWYKELNKDYSSSEKSPKKTASKKRASEKLMEESHKKFVTKKIDRNILKRAMEKEDEE